MKVLDLCSGLSAGRLLAATALWMAGLCAASAQGSAIQSVSSAVQGQNIVLKVELSSPLTQVPNSFTVTNPARIALDLPGVSNALGKNLVEIGQADLRSVAVVQAGERSRLVLNLRQPMQHKAELSGSALLITLSPPAVSETPASSPAPLVAAQVPAGLPEVRNIDFRRTPEGAGRVVIELGDRQTGVDIRQQGNSVVIDLIRSQVPEPLRRKLDVTDFATPVQSITTTQNGANARVLIQPTGLWEHNAFQTDTQLVVEVKPVKEDPNKLFQGTRIGYRGEKLSLNFQDVEVRALLQVIADFTNTNIIASDSVGGNITLRLRDVPWDQALDIILQARGLDMRKNGNVIVVAPREELATREKLELEARSQIGDLEPLRTEAFQINYQKAEAVAALLNNPQQRLLSRRGTVVAEPRTNQLFINDIAERLDTVRSVIARIDVPTRQVLIEARIVEADDTFSRNLGVRLGFLSARPNGTPLLGDSTTRFNIGAQLGANGLTAPIVAPGASGTGTGAAVATNTNFVNLPAGTINGRSPGSLAVSIFGNGLSQFLNLEVSALEADGKGKVISSPRVVTADQVKAVIEQGEEIPYQQATSSGATSVSFRKATLRLEVTPQITPEGSIILNLNVNKDSRGVDTISGPAINTKNVQTQVLVENGGTVVIGGIFIQDERNDLTQVPVLGDVPVLGNLFKTRSRSNLKREMLVFISPRVVDSRLTTAR
jgi:type IV pilus assembly protein PilQ